MLIGQGLSHIPFCPARAVAAAHCAACNVLSFLPCPSAPPPSSSVLLLDWLQPRRLFRFSRGSTRVKSQDQDCHLIKMTTLVYFNGEPCEQLYVKTSGASPTKRSGAHVGLHEADTTSVQGMTWHCCSWKGDIEGSPDGQVIHDKMSVAPAELSTAQLPRPGTSLARHRSRLVADPSMIPRVFHLTGRPDTVDVSHRHQ